MKGEVCRDVVSPLKPEDREVGTVMQVGRA